MDINLILGTLLAYMIGSIPFSFLIARWKGNIDLREFGSRNVGARNLSRAFGWGWGRLGAVLDVLKGTMGVMIPVFLLDLSPPGSYLTAAAAVAGHNWPIYLKFHGGKGLATAAGAMFVFAPWVMISGAASAALFLFIFKHPLGASLFGFLIAGISTYLFDYAQDTLLLVAGLFALALLAVLTEFLSKRRGAEPS